MRLGISLSPQVTTWPDIALTAAAVERLGYDYLCTWDHLLSPLGPPDQDVFESWTLLAALAVATERVMVGTLVTANTFRHPALIAKMAVTLDHLSAGRCVLGIGAGWHHQEHVSHGIEFGGSARTRIEWLDEALTIIRGLIDGKTVTASKGERYSLDHVQHRPRPIQPHIPILVGGWGPSTLAVVARHADIWNAKGSPEELSAKSDQLARQCEQLGRDPASVERSITCRMLIRSTRPAAGEEWERVLAKNGCDPSDEPDAWVGTPGDIATRLRSYARIGFSSLFVSVPAPYDHETIERLITEAVPLAEAQR